MELKITGDCLARVSVDMKKFKEDFRKTLDLKESIRKNFTIVENKEKELLNEELLFRSVYNLLDWGRILELINDIDEDVMGVRFFSCEFREKAEVVPDMVSEDGRHFIFRQELKSGNDIIMINSFINSPDYDVASYLKSNYFNYGFKRWKPLVDLDE
mgnify:FL=1